MTSKIKSPIALSILFILLFTLFCFTSCDNLASWKDNAVDKFDEWKGSDFFHEVQTITSTPTITTTTMVVATPTTTIKPIATTTTKITTTTPKPTYKNPSWEELKTFLLEDETDELPYIYPTFVCQDFAETLQRNAHKAGWRCGIVSMEKTGYDDPLKLGIASNAGHACNVFETTDKGLLYIDCTGWLNGIGSFPADRLAILEIGQRQKSTFIFPHGSICVNNISVIRSINIRW